MLVLTLLYLLPLAQSVPPIGAETFWTELGKSGPFAVVAGFLLWVVINAWKEDRTKVLPVLTTVTDILKDLKSAVVANTESNKAIAEGQAELLREMREHHRGTRG